MSKPTFKTTSMLSLTLATLGGSGLLYAASKLTAAQQHHQRAARHRR